MMTGFEQYTRKTRRAIFLEEMEQVVPWRELCALVDPHYPKPGNGRPPVGVERMLRIYFLQQWFNLSDPAVEDALYDSAVMRQFVGSDLGCEPPPDETTVCKFRHLLEEHRLRVMVVRYQQLRMEPPKARKDRTKWTNRLPRKSCPRCSQIPSIACGVCIPSSHRTMTR
jgi:hypothetical protein